MIMSQKFTKKNICDTHKNMIYTQKHNDFNSLLRITVEKDYNDYNC